MRVYPFFLLTGIFTFFLSGCSQTTSTSELEKIAYDPTPVFLEKPRTFQAMVIPADNPLTEEGIALGRRLFYDPILSRDESISCANCHFPTLAFTDAQRVSIGVDGAKGRRSSPSLLNVGYYYKGLFWDGRVMSLEEQAFHPVRDHLEMALGWEEADRRMQMHPEYPALFRKAFGIQKAEQIDSTLTAKALAQFQRSLVSHDTKFDRIKRGEAEFTEAELRGFTIFFDADPALPNSECGHCHVDPLFTNQEYFNNGILDADEQEAALDEGRAEVSGRSGDRFAFRTPSLRNIVLTAPYMHDGRFQTLDEVLDHYASGGHFAENVNPNVRHLNLNRQNKNDLIAFLNTLTDSTALNKPDYRDPSLN